MCFSWLYLYFSRSFLSLCLSRIFSVSLGGVGSISLGSDQFGYWHQAPSPASIFQGILAFQERVQVQERVKTKVSFAFLPDTATEDVWSF